MGAGTGELHRSAFGHRAPSVAWLLRGCRCAVHLRHREEFAEHYPDSAIAMGELFVFDGDAISCVGGTASIVGTSRALGFRRTGLDKPAWNLFFCARETRTGQVEDGDRRRIHGNTTNTAW